jgi:rhodanese-related sulfurtransferase
MPPADLLVTDATASEAFDSLRRDPDARLIDVRTRAEWAFVGVPDLGGVSEPILVEWQTYPMMAVDPAFGEVLERTCPDKTAALYFLCRSGARSLAAAREMRARGYTRVFNVTDGFEGPPDHAGHRGTVAGWKASGLPWRQT